MSDPYVGEIRMWPGNFAPVGWLFCQGQLLPISENETLFQLIGTTYGGDGQSTFALPNLQGRLPVHQGNGMVLGQQAGVEEVTLTVNQVPAHTHPLTAAKTLGNASSPAGNVLAESPGGVKPYIQGSPSVPMAATAIGTAGGSQPHTNLQPYLCINFIISLFGIFPPPS
ncbi:MAG TPA: tail fiber protein [Acidimicrobiales bacterium]|nr:tail fiber protein [Acidimicrobiales bacterium]